MVQFDCAKELFMFTIGILIGRIFYLPFLICPLFYRLFFIFSVLAIGMTIKEEVQLKNIKPNNFKLNM